MAGKESHIYEPLIEVIENQKAKIEDLRHQLNLRTLELKDRDDAVYELQNENE